MIEKKNDEIHLWNWLSTASDDERRLFELIEECEECFEDMLFRPGTSTQALIKVQARLQGEDEWADAYMDLPYEELECFSLAWFTYKVENLDEDVNGYYSPKEQVLCIAPNSLNKQTVLHEMIHLHEHVINELPLFFHDSAFWALYTDLKKKIPNLDEIISNHAHILISSDLYDVGGLHDILFLLKSFDLDIRMKYPLGTVFGYGRCDNFKDYTYEEQ